MSDPGVQTSLLGFLSRTRVLLIVCCVPTVLVTAVVAYNHGAFAPSGVHLDIPPVPHSTIKRDVPRVVAQPMLPGAQPANSGGIVALVSYAGDISALPATAMVFVFARRAGVPMPVAVEKYQPSQLPVEVVFRAPDDTGEPLQIVARLSRNGGVRLETGDVEASSDPMVAGSEEFRIDLEIPPL